MTRYLYKIKGQVQGVGFRPFIYKIAHNLNLSGYIKNDYNGVIIEIEGKIKNIEEFNKLLKKEKPPLANIYNIKIIEIDILHTGQFEIIQSEKSSNPSKIVSVLPDTKICEDCLIEVNSLKNKNLNNKYHNYFATNCTNCGPRYSIIQTVPYDRINTSMKDFILCEDCQKEYTNPLNRRYHAQPTSCKNCGPKLELSVKGLGFSTFEYEKISKFIQSGKIGAIKGIGGFHIVCDASNDEIIQKLRVYKNRPTKPFAIMCKDLEQIKTIANVSSKEEELLNSKEVPIVILDKNKQDIISNFIAPNISKIGCFVPYSAFYSILFKYLKNPIIATSANLGGGAIIINKEDILSKLPFIDFIVDYNRDIINGVDDSVVQVVNNDISILRQSRGYAPKEIILDKKINKKILCLGANDKNTISLMFDNKIVTSPYIGSLDNIETYEFFKRTIKTFERFYDFKPDIIIHDKHPLYVSTKYAKEEKRKNSSLQLIEVQHHLSHIYACMAEYNLKEKYLSFCFDGTGYGDDKTLWGAEVFIGDKRVYSFKQIKLLGGSKAIKEPKRVALAMLFDKYSLDEVLKADFELLNHFKKNEIKLLHKAYTSNLNSPLASSIGRLFDGVASFANICQVQTYEGEAGLLCENAYDKTCKKSFSYTINNNIIDINFDFKNKQLVSMFINTLVNIIIDISKKQKLEVILSGGVFQNKTLLELLDSEFKKENINYFYAKNTSINDGAISLGQAFYWYNKFV